MVAVCCHLVVGGQRVEAQHLLDWGWPLEGRVLQTGKEEGEHPLGFLSLGCRALGRRLHHLQQLLDDLHREKVNGN